MDGELVLELFADEPELALTVTLDRTEVPLMITLDVLLLTTF